ncbi:hypothetical protein ABZ845_04520 [Streptomyces sp. NPDC047022]|uniref:hypothetical protein n=1 Tax=Streptomyces sp. NPDC047022 TaxID=3155737 RepID=UPI0033FA0ACB
MAEANLTATEANAKPYQVGRNDVDKLVRAWADSRGRAVDGDWTKHFVHVGQDAYGHGRDRSLMEIRSDR